MGNPILYKDSSGNTALAGAAIGSVAGPVGAVIGAVVGTVAMVAGAVYYKEHTYGARKSTLNKHQQGQSRKKEIMVVKREMQGGYQERIKENRRF